MQYQTKDVASQKAKKASKRTNSLIKEYKCNYCGYFHIGHTLRGY